MQNIILLLSVTVLAQGTSFLGHVRSVRELRSAADQNGAPDWAKIKGMAGSMKVPRSLKPKIVAKVSASAKPKKVAAPIILEATIYTVKPITFANNSAALQSVATGFAKTLEVTISAVRVDPRWLDFKKTKWATNVLDVTFTLPAEFWPFSLPNVPVFLKKFPIPRDSKMKKRTFLRKLETAAQKELAAVPGIFRSAYVKFSKLDIPFPRWEEHGKGICDEPLHLLPGVGTESKRSCQAYCEANDACQFFSFSSLNVAASNCLMYSQCSRLSLRGGSSFKVHKKPKTSHWQPASFIKKANKLGSAASEGACRKMCMDTGAATCALTCDGCYSSAEDAALTAVTPKDNFKCAKSAIDLWQASLKITIRRAHGLQKADKLGARHGSIQNSDPFVQCWVAGLPIFSFKTRTEHNTQTPHWDYSHTFVDFAFDSTLHFTVWDEDKNSTRAPTLLGQASLKPWKIGKAGFEGDLALESAEDNAISAGQTLPSRPATLAVKVELVPLKPWFTIDKTDAAARAKSVEAARKIAVAGAVAAAEREVKKENAKKAEQRDDAKKALAKRNLALHLPSARKENAKKAKPRDDAQKDLAKRKLALHLPSVHKENAKKAKQRDDVKKALEKRKLALKKGWAALKAKAAGNPAKLKMIKAIKVKALQAQAIKDAVDASTIIAVAGEGEVGEGELSGREMGEEAEEDEEEDAEEDGEELDEAPWSDEEMEDEEEEGQDMNKAVDVVGDSVVTAAASDAQEKMEDAWGLANSANPFGNFPYGAGSESEDQDG